MDGTVPAHTLLVTVTRALKGDCSLSNWLYQEDLLLLYMVTVDCIEKRTEVEGNGLHQQDYTCW